MEQKENGYKGKLRGGSTYKVEMNIREKLEKLYMHLRRIFVLN